MSFFFLFTVASFPNRYQHVLVRRFSAIQAIQAGGNFERNWTFKHRKIELWVEPHTFWWDIFQKEYGILRVGRTIKSVAQASSNDRASRVELQVWLQLPKRRTSRYWSTVFQQLFPSGFPKVMTQVRARSVDYTTSEVGQRCLFSLWTFSQMKLKWLGIAFETLRVDFRNEEERLEFCPERIRFEAHLRV